MGQEIGSAIVRSQCFSSLPLKSNMGKVVCILRNEINEVTKILHVECCSIYILFVLVNIQQK